MSISRLDQRRLRKDTRSSFHSLVSNEGTFLACVPRRLLKKHFSSADSAELDDELRLSARMLSSRALAGSTGDDAEVSAANVVVGQSFFSESMSTTRTTARPSRTLRTLSASQFPRNGDDNVELADVDGELPVKASQNEDVSLLSSVWEAYAARST